MFRIRLAIFGLLVLAQSAASQVLHDPQQFYDDPEGLFDMDSLRTIDIQFYDPNYHQQLVDGWETMSGLRLPASVSLSNGESLDSVAIRYKGNSTCAIANDNNNPKLPLNLDMNQIVSGQKLMDYKKVKLANSLFDPTFCKEIVGYDIYRRYLPSSLANFMKVNLQGNYLGLYVNTQAVDKQFLKQHFDEKDGVFFKCDPVGQFGQTGVGATSNLEWLGEDTTLYYDHYTIKSDHGWTELMELIASINSPLFPIDSMLNVDRVLWAFAVNTVLLNLDTYNGLFQHNYYLYQTEDGLFQMIPWDMTESFVGGLLNFNPNIDELYEYDPYNGYSSWWQPLCHQLTSDDADPFYRKLYSNHIRTVLEESLDAMAITSRVDELQALAANAASSDQNQMFGTGQYYANVDAPFVIQNVFATAGITPSITARQTHLATYPELIAAAPLILSTDVFHVGDSAFVTCQVSNLTEIELMVTTSPYNSKFKSYSMYDDGSHGDAISGDGIFTAPLPFQGGTAEIKYYIRAQNADAISLDPIRAEYEFYIYDQFLSVKEDVNSAFTVFPNPTNSSVTIQTNGFNGSEYSLTSILGTQVLSGRVNSTKTVLDLSELESGVYLLRMNGATVKLVRSAY
ncbi:MAG: hypothetical protein ACI85F_000443 [Bacteroidia bacterium]|jgi:hypothetical protein